MLRVSGYKVICIIRSGYKIIVSIYNTYITPAPLTLPISNSNQTAQVELSLQCSYNLIKAKRQTESLKLNKGSP